MLKFFKIPALIVLSFVFLAIGGKILSDHKKEPLFSGRAEDYREIKDYEIVSELPFRFRRPFGIAINSRGEIYVSEFYEKKGDNARILRFDERGNLLGWLGKGERTTGYHSANSLERSLPGAGDGEFVGVSKLAFDEADRLYVLDGASTDSVTKAVTGNHRVQVFNADLNFRGWIGASAKKLGWHEPGEAEGGIVTTEEGGFDTPDGLLIVGDNLLIGSWSAMRVDRFGTSGEYRGWLGKGVDGSFGWHAPKTARTAGSAVFGEEAGAFQAPIGLAIDFFRRLYVADFSSDPVISIFDFDTGNFIWGINRKEGMRPDNLIVDRYGNIILSDYDDGSVRFLNKDGEKTLTMQLGPGRPYFGASAFAFNDAGELYFVEYTKEKVYRVKLIYR